VTFQILTGAPGAGKTVLLRGLELAGYGVVEEAATDVIAWRQATGCMEPWKQPDFVDAILDLQIRRQAASDCQGRSVYLDRSPVCTLALCRFLGLTPTERLNQETAPDRLRALYRPLVLFVRGLGFITPTSARRISLEEAARFESIHRQTYEDLGFGLLEIPAASAADRVKQVLAQS
jgi:predicted ATPase